ncbi:MAG: peptidoglycan DD-metalloendopeptidase family protein [Candidatus Omnitrophica bacterium]|nr:peptidoglycan DD-metalloendopeptidase family protein [Candidatus Omnitrophota bacterium]
MTTKNLEKDSFSPKPIPPDGIHHKIRQGETLWDIAKAYGVKCDLLERYNPDVNPRRMQLDQKIFIPGADSPVVITRKSRMVSPISNTVIVSGFGMRKHPLGGVLRFHRGIDLKADSGTPVRAVMDGVIIEAGWQGTLGRYIKIRHSGGFETVYAHNSRIKVRKGQRVKQGQTISLSGNTGRSTGPHLHFEVIKNGKHVDPVQYLPRINHSPSSRYTKK